MKKILISVLISAMLFVNTAFAAMFPDTERHWAKDYIENLTMEGVIAGNSDGNFNPDSYVTREQFLKMLSICASRDAETRNLMENPPKDEVGTHSPFADVSTDRWSCYYIQEAYGTIIFTDEYGENFEPVKDITREEAAIWMSRALQLTSATPSFTDNVLIGNPDMVGAAAAAGLITGFEDGSFRPGEPLTRAQAAVMLTRAGKLNASIMLSYYTETIKEFERDLNLDGVNESVKIKANQNGYMVLVNDLAVLGGECDIAENRYYIIDIDKNDKYKEIAIAETVDDNMSLAVYRYTGSNLYLMGRIKTAGGLSVRTDATPIGDEWGAVSVNQDGTITANIGVQFVHTMLVRKQYKVNNKMRLEAAQDEFYTIGNYSNFTVINNLESAVSDEKHPKITLSPGYTGSIVKTDLKNWIYVETGSGDKGWIYADDRGLVNGNHISYYLDGLNYAG